MKSLRPPYFFAVLLLLLLILTYSNHFNNGFHFDDAHSLVDNIFIRNIKNIPLFFKDASTLTSLPLNQSYRPLIPTLYAIDYWIAGNKLDPFYFHLSTFIWYILQCFLMYFLYLKVFQSAATTKWTNYIALFAVGWYALHTANAETINYISARSDSISTFWLIVSFVIYIFRPALRKWGIYLVPLAIGILVKPAILVFPGLLFFYVLFFEEHAGLNEWSKAATYKKIGRSIYASLPSLLVCAGLYIFQNMMTPETFIPGGPSRYLYLITQPFVTWHYFQVFFLPVNLSADTDWTVLTSIWNYRFFAGIGFVLLMLFIVFKTSVKQETRPIAFGILWFFIALLPTSSFIPFAEVLNDHRTFFPYIGLLLSVVWSIYLLFLKKQLEKEQIIFKRGIVILVFLFLGTYAYSTYQRNKIWLTGETLWYDVTIKSPNNGRGLMNYGLTQMSKGNYTVAEEYFLKTLKKMPHYPYLHINLGVLKEATNDAVTAEVYFRNGIQFGSGNPEAYYYYAKFLSNQKRTGEAIPLLEKALVLSKAHTYARYLLMSIYAEQYNWQKLTELAKETLEIVPNDPVASNYLEAGKNRKTKLEMALDAVKASPTPENYLDLSLKYYNEGLYEKSIDACKEALKIKPDYAEAYNNICSANNQLRKWEEAIDACEKALKIKPDYELAVNNLKLVRDRKTRIENALNTARSNSNPENYLSLSLVYYTEGMYAECIEACREAIKLKPDYPEAYNNICTAYNQLSMWEEAIKACEQAIKLNPDFQLAKNNLAWANSQKNLNLK